jgi:DNA-binding IclR family transcriptional regulator
MGADRTPSVAQIHYSIQELDAREGGVPFGSRCTINETVARAVSDYQARGYAVSVGETEPHIAAIALPIAGPAGALGAINIVFFRSAMSTTEAAKRYLAPLRTCVQGIETAMAAGGDVR